MTIKTVKEEKQPTVVSMVPAQPLFTRFKKELEMNKRC